MSALKSEIGRFLPQAAAAAASVAAPAQSPSPPTAHPVSPTFLSYNVLHVIRNGTNQHRHHYESTNLYGIDMVQPTTDTSNLTNCEFDEPNANSALFETIVYIMYISIFIFALLGNGIVTYIVFSSPRMRTVTNYFIVNLAVGDILLTLFCVPFSFFSILILQYWPYGSVLCHLVNYCQAVSVLVSAYTLVAISVDRYSAILWPLRPRITKR